jgi:hypothetical protein
MSGYRPGHRTTVPATLSAIPDGRAPHARPEALARILSTTLDPPMHRSLPLEVRVRPFLDAGLLRAVPTRWQIRLGQIEMTPYVISTDATAEEGYRSGFGHPLVRQPIIFSQVGLDHLRTGSALGARLDSLCAHLQLTFHRGMPVFDLQAVQTHPGGLDRLAEAIDAIRTGRAARRHAIARLILRDPDAYFARFTGADGWIERARRFDYPSAADQESDFPPEFFSLVGFLDHCTRSFPPRPSADPRQVARAPGRLVALATRRFREGRGFGWFDHGAG